MRFISLFVVTWLAWLVAAADAAALNTTLPECEDETCHERFCNDWASERAPEANTADSDLFERICTNGDFHRKLGDNIGAGAPSNATSGGAMGDEAGGRCADAALGQERR